MNSITDVHPFNQKLFEKNSRWRAGNLHETVNIADKESEWQFKQANSRISSLQMKSSAILGKSTLSIPSQNQLDLFTEFQSHRALTHRASTHMKRFVEKNSGGFICLAYLLQKAAKISFFIKPFDNEFRSVSLLPPTPTQPNPNPTQSHLTCLLSLSLYFVRWQRKMISDRFSPINVKNCTWENKNTQPQWA